MADPRKLKQEAMAASSDGNWRKAATCYANLERAEPAEPSWSLKLGECLRKLGNDEEAIKSFARAASGYAQQEMLLKAIAVCKIILGIEPTHTRTQDLLASLYATQDGPTVAVPAVPPVAAGPVQAPRPTSRTPTARQPAPATPAHTATAPATAPPRRPLTPLPPSHARIVPAPEELPPLSQLRLAEMIPGASLAAQVGPTGSATAMRIPIDDAVAAGPSTASNPHKGAGRNTMARFVLPKTPFFSVLTPELFRMAVERVRLIQLAKGEILFAKGDPGDTLFVVAWGEVAILVPQEVARLAEGDFFGEIALLADRPRTATVRATVDSQVLALDRSLLTDLVAASPELLKVLLRFLRERLMATLAQTSPIFAPFTALERIGLAARFQFLEIDEGLRMVEEGAKSPGVFVLLSGSADVIAGGRPIGRLTEGDVFGELSIITGQAATADVAARGKCFVLFLPRVEFTELIMTHPQVLEHISAVAEARRNEIGRVNLL